MDHPIDSTILDELVVVDKNTRFNLHLIDGLILFALFLTYIFSMEAIFGVIRENDYGRLLGGLFFYLAYYTGFEYVFSKTPGKFMTKTRVVNKSGNKPEFIRLLIRGICRLIPFDDVSYLLDKRGWHDQISGTYVINEK
jgi:uncharacterized RDD family membrane protein YckC